MVSQNRFRATKKYDKKQIASSLNWGVLTAYPSQHRAATDNRGELQRGGKRRI